MNQARDHNHDGRYVRTDPDSGCGCLVVIVLVLGYYLYVQFFGPGFGGLLYWVQWLVTCGGTCSGK